MNHPVEHYQWVRLCPIKKARKNISGKKLSSMVGISHGYLKCIETGVKRLPHRLVKPISEITGVNPTDFAREYEIWISLKP